MGYASRMKKLSEAAATERRRTLPLRILKGLVNILLFPILLPYLFFLRGFEDNEWAWKI